MMEIRKSLRLFLALALVFPGVSCASAQTFEMMPETRPVPLRAPDTLAVGIVVEKPAARFVLPGGGILRDADNRTYLAPVSRLTFEAGSAGITLLLDDVPGSVSSSWTIEPLEGDSAVLEGRRYRGAFTVVASPRAGGRETPVLTAVNVVPLEEYLRGVVPREMGFTRPENIEALKVQAVISRTYAIRNLGRRQALGFDLHATTDDQVYGGADAEVAIADEAVRATVGEVLAYESTVIDAYFHSTCGGHTADLRDAWGGDRPYLRGVGDELGETFACAISRYFRWTERYTGNALQALAAGAPSIGIAVVERDTWGRNRAVRIVRGDSEELARGDMIRRALRRPEGGMLRSTVFEVVPETEAIRLEGRGWGHGVGLCQMGSIGRARAGQSCRAILEHYYPGAAIVRLRRPGE